MPGAALRYRLCEVGSRRLDPRELSHLLPILTEAGDDGICINDGLYVSTELSEAEREDKTASALKRLSRLGLTVKGETREFANTSELATVTLRKAIQETGNQTSDADTGNTTTTFSIIRSGGVAPLLVTILADANWLYPDAQLLWAHARHAREIGAHPVYLARKVAPVTFSLLSAFSARALQFYDMLTPVSQSAELHRDADTLGLPKLRAASQIHEHAVMNQLVNLIAERPEEAWNPNASAAFDDGIKTGFADAQVSVAQFERWTEQHAELPLRWPRTINATDHPSGSHGIVLKKQKLKATKTGHHESNGGYGRATQKSRVPFRV